MSRDRDPVVDRRTDFLARTKGTRAFPWRVLVVAKRDADLLENETVFKLGGELELEDTSWIRPGKVAWDWYNANNLFGVDFRPGVNTKSYEYFIDFAARYGIEYVILDEGWYVLGDLMKTTPEMDVPHLFEYAAEKGVSLIPWVVWKTFDDQLEEALDQFLGPVPSVWDRTIGLDAKVGDYALVARRSGEEWYVGGMTDWEPRTLEAGLDFLAAGRYKMEVWRDGPNADRYASDFARETRSVSREDRIRIELAPGGGWVARLTKE